MSFGSHRGKNIPKPLVFECKYSAPSIFDIKSLQNVAKPENKIVPRRVELNEKLWMPEMIYRNLITGEIARATSVIGAVQGRTGDYSGEDWVWLLNTAVYAKPQSLQRQWGAYILPHGIEVGDRVYLPELIEDIYVTEFWSAKYYAVDGVAIWDGVDLQLDLEPYKHEPITVG